MSSGTSLAPLLSRARRHGGLIVVLGLASALRVVIDRNAVPGVYQDSLVYLRAFPHAPFAPFSPTRPSGYPLVLRILDVLPGHHLNTVTFTQHVAGLVVGILVYVLVLRVGVGRGIALASAVLVLGEVYTVALEQDVLAETFFTLAITAAAYLTLRRSETAWSLVAGGLLLGAACTIRSVGMFVVPVWALWLVLARPGPKVVLAGLAAVAFPVVGYCAVHAAGGAGFSLQGSDGWFLYAKVGPIADCAGASVRPEAEPLCVAPEPDRDRPFEFYLYEGGSPAYKTFHGGTAVYLEDAITPENNRILRRFSLAVIKAHPAAFGELVGTEFFRYLGPSTAQSELSLYGQPGTLLRMYERALHMRWWLFSGTLAAGVVAMVARRRVRELSLLVGMTVALVLGAAATSGFNNRYLVPAFPLVAVIAALVLDEVLRDPEREEERPDGAGA